MKLAYAAGLIGAFVVGMALPQQQQVTPEAKKKQQEARQRTMSFLTPEERAHLQENGKINRQEWIAAHPRGTPPG